MCASVHGYEMSFGISSSAVGWGGWGTGLEQKEWGLGFAHPFL